MSHSAVVGWTHRQTQSTPLFLTTDRMQRGEILARENGCLLLPHMRRLNWVWALKRGAPPITPCRCTPSYQLLRLQLGLPRLTARAHRGRFVCLCVGVLERSDYYGCYAPIHRVCPATKHSETIFHVACAVWACAEGPCQSRIF